MATNFTPPTRCPKCGTDLDGGAIPEDIRQHYAPPYRWSRAILLKALDGDDKWKCPDCAHEWR